MARPHDASDRRPVAIKLSAWKGLEAHPKHVRAGNKAGEATVKRFDVHSNHGGASNDDGDVPVAVVDKMIKQQGLKHHGIKAKLEQHRARTVTHRGALATVTRARRRFCRPRGRKATSGVSR